MDLHQTPAPVALITGAARRIGASIARYLHHAGFNVMLHYLHSEHEAKALAQQLCQIRPDSARLIQANLTHIATLPDLVANTCAWKARLDLLVNNASVFARDDVANWETLFLTNVKAPFALSHAAFDYLAENSGAVVNITDTHADTPLTDYTIYCQTKAALAMQTKALAKAFAPDVRVNAVAPGAIVWPEGDNSLLSEEQAKIIDKTWLKRHGAPEYIAQAVLALARNPFITGQSLKVDGGR